MIPDFQRLIDRAVADSQHRIAKKEQATMNLTQLQKGHQVLEKYDVFISHATEDKATFVDKLVKELQEQSVNVWYDSLKIIWGSSLREKIDEGLSKAKFGIVVLSPDYIKEGKYWTKRELDALFQLEGGSKTQILPIWHNLTYAEVVEYSPIIAAKRALLTSELTPKEIADELRQILDKMEANDGQT